MSMSKYDKTIEKLEQDAIILQYVKTIQKEDLVLPEWFELNEDYKTAKHPLAKVIITIRNSILFQRRIFFCLTRKTLRSLLEVDENWEIKGKFKNEKYSYLMKLLTETFGIIKLAQKNSNSRGLDVYQVIDQSLLKYLKIDENKQFEQTVTFVSKYKELTKGDQKRDLVNSKKEIVISNKKLNETSFLDILNQSNVISIINELKTYECNNPRTWKDFILKNCDEEKSKTIISNLGL